MQINDVENIVGLSKKSIRYYEEMCLIKPSRNKDNDYRVYSEEDIKKLKIIKFLRELDVPIKELQELNTNKLSLKECMENRINKIKNEEEKYLKIRNMCENIINSNEEYNTIDINAYFQNVRILNKEGFTMYNNKSNHHKKIMGAILSSLIFIIFFCSILIPLTYLEFTGSIGIPLILYLLLTIILILLIISIIFNLISRIKEIIGGEEDEASKY